MIYVYVLFFSLACHLSQLTVSGLRNRKRNWITFSKWPPQTDIPPDTYIEIVSPIFCLTYIPTFYLAFLPASCARVWGPAVPAEIWSSQLMRKRARVGGGQEAVRPALLKSRDATGRWGTRRCFTTHVNFKFSKTIKNPSPNGSKHCLRRYLPVTPEIIPQSHFLRYG